ncbi:hypothetical protein ACN20G_11930 [Streptomyces sp. BI20]|uniref:hypothetical protein n=1 Tax=Streptomyces sp. BI20 TaxID=3403460 RepID=UPI003C743606
MSVVDRCGTAVDACEAHGARLLASLEDGRVYPHPSAPTDVAIRVFGAARSTRPFAWVDGPRTSPPQLSRTETETHRR